jgi:hypothetical protein
MTRYIDKDGNLTFDDATITRLTKMVAEIESDAVPLHNITGLSREQRREYLFGQPSPETLAKVTEVRFSELQRKS